MNYYLYKVATFIAFAYLASQNFASAQNIDSLLQVRQMQIASNESTRDTDKLLQATGHAPEALLIGSDPFSISFATYLGNDNAQREQKLNLRLKAHYTFISSISFNSDYSVVTIRSNEKYTPAMINELVSHFGYIGYAVK